MTHPSHLRRLTVCFALTLALASCAVLTVDVDVYKGALTNHPDVQIEQMAVMAIGAKPLLVELRDLLEGDGDVNQTKRRLLPLLTRLNRVQQRRHKRKITTLGAASFSIRYPATSAALTSPWTRPRSPYWAY